MLTDLLACEICGATENLVNHHISYDPEEITIVCHSCHTTLHANNLAPKRPLDFRQKQKIQIPAVQRRKGGVGQGGFLRILNPHLYVKKSVKEGLVNV